MTSRTGVALAAIALGGSLVVPASAASAPAERAGDARAPQAGTYQGTTFDEGKPNSSEYVRFRVTKGGKKVKGFKTRIGMYCYVGAPVYHQIVPTVVTAPPMKIKKGNVDRGWTDVYEAGGVKHALRGRLVIKFRHGRPSVGKVAVDFASCGTTTGTPRGYVPFKVRRKK